MALVRVMARSLLLSSRDLYTPQTTGYGVGYSGSSNTAEAWMMANGSVSDIRSWDNQTVMHNVEIFHPASVEDVKSFIDLAQQRSPPSSLRVLGHSHSFSPILADSGSIVLIMDKFIDISEDPSDRLLVRVGAGVTWGELATWSEEEGRGAERFSYVPNAPLASAMTVVGTAMTASHGSTKTSPMHDWIERLRVINAHGGEDIYDKHVDPRAWALAVSSLGVLGVVIEAWVRFDNHTAAVDFTVWKLPMDQLFPDKPSPTAQANLLKIYQNYDSHHFVWGPMNGARTQNLSLISWDIANDRVTCYLSRRTYRPVPPYRPNQTAADLGLLPGDHGVYTYFSDQSNPAKEQFDDIAKLNVFYSLPPDMVSSPGAVGTFASQVEEQSVPATSASNISETWPRTTAAAIHFQKWLELSRPSVDTSFVFRVSDDFSNLIEFWSGLRRVFQTWLKDYNLVPITSLVSLRLTRGSNVTLSPAKGSSTDVYAWLEIATAAHTPGVLSIPPGRPIRKTFQVDIYEEFVRVSKRTNTPFKLHLAKFKGDAELPFTSHILSTIKDELVALKGMADEKDPEGVFRNAYLKDLLSRV